MTRLKFIIALLFGCTVAASASAQQERRFVRSGNAFYEKADYDKAGENYMKALDKNKESVEAIANMGNVLYKQGGYEASGEIFSRLAENEADTSLRSRDYYNLGNALFKQRRFEEALEAYKNALRMDPSDTDAKFNLAYTRKMLDKDDDESGGGGNDGGDNKDDNSGHNKDGGGDTDNNRDDDKGDEGRSNDDSRNGDDDAGDDASGAMSRKEAERLLDLMQAEENRTSEKVDRDKAGAVVRGGKNW